MPAEAPDRKHVYHQYTVRLPGGRRDEIQKKLDELGVSTMVYYPVSVHQLPVYAGQGVSMPVAEHASTEVLSLPIWPQMEREVQVRVVEAVKEALK